MRRAGSGSYGIRALHHGAGLASVTLQLVDSIPTEGRCSDPGGTFVRVSDADRSGTGAGVLVQPHHLDALTAMRGLRFGGQGQVSSMEERALFSVVVVVRFHPYLTRVQSSAWVHQKAVFFGFHWSGPESPLEESEDEEAISSWGSVRSLPHAFPWVAVHLSAPTGGERHSQHAMTTPSTRRRRRRPSCDSAGWVKRAKHPGPAGLALGPGHVPGSGMCELRRAMRRELAGTAALLQAVGC
ncbi:hypothetical protein ACFC1R_27585 [Kitasatospora sp. NPDC056138]|uniref:hypothetical protein n=1 Tax=Kitasatospora sp. NPDC056138 TaxID=3345724 RepID=UPI0035D8165D